MQFTLSIIVGLLLGGVGLALVRPKGLPRRFRSRPTYAGWIALVAGVIGLAALGSGLAFGRVMGDQLLPLSIMLPFAVLVFVIGCLVRGERSWASWAGLLLASTPALFWIVFAAAEVIGPAH